MNCGDLNQNTKPKYLRFNVPINNKATASLMFYFICFFFFVLAFSVLDSIRIKHININNQKILVALKFKTHFLLK